MTTSLVVRGGTVYDGSGGPGRRTDVAVDGDRIGGLAELPDRSGESDVLDASGCAVAPGFINVLSHAWGSLQTDGRGASDLLQGVTTEVFGEAFSPGPTSEGFTDLLGSSGIADGVRADFARLSEGLDYLESQGVAANVASFVGGHNLRIIGGGLSDAPLGREAVDRVLGVLEEEMAEGALGIGTALIYPPGCFADTAELVAMSRVVSAHDGLYISHMRSEGDRFLECLDELVEIGRQASVRTEVYHLKAAGRSNWPKMALAVERIEAARAAGQPVAANMYPYTAGGTALAAAIPPQFHVGGADQLARRLADPAQRAQMSAAIEQPGEGWENLYLAAGGGSGILVLAANGTGRSYLGRQLADIAAERAAGEAGTLLDLVAEDPTIGVAYFIMDEANVALGLRQPWVSIGSDSAAIAAEPPATDQPTHPRTYGTFARVLGRYSRDLRLFDTAEAVRKMTSLPAERFRLTDRGRLAPGAFADLVVFDPATVADTADYVQSHSYATGVRHVVVNGVPVVRDGELTGARPGRRLRRGR